jgi:hypothetical protein
VPRSPFRPRSGLEGSVQLGRGWVGPTSWKTMLALVRSERQVADFVDDEQGWPHVGLEWRLNWACPARACRHGSRSGQGMRLGPRYRERRHHGTRPARLRYHLRSLPNNARRGPTTWKRVRHAPPVLATRCNRQADGRRRIGQPRAVLALPLLRDLPRRLS